MDNLETEEEVFAAATASEAPTPAPATPEPSAPAAEVVTPDEPGAEPAPEQQGQDHLGGDLKVALRKEREEIKRIREQNAQLMAMLQRNAAPQPAQPETKPEAVQLWDDPDKWGQSVVEPVISEVQQTREYYSRREAVREHGAEKVDEAYQALDAAIARGEVNKDAVLGALRKSLDPFGEIMGWYDNQPANAEKRLREKILSELRSSGQIPAEASQGQPAAPSNVPSLPSLNRAIGNAGAPQGGSITDEDIFNAAPAFGRRKA